MKNDKIKEVTILHKTGDAITRIGVKYGNSRKVVIIEDSELVPLIMLFWVAKCAGVGSRIDNATFH